MFFLLNIIIVLEGTLFCFVSIAMMEFRRHCCGAVGDEARHLHVNQVYKLRTYLII